MSHPDDSPASGTKVYAKDKRALLGGLGTLIGGVGVAIGAWAHQKISDHDARLVHIEVQQANDGQRALEEKERMDRMDAKLDRILERLPR